MCFNELRTSILYMGPRWGHEEEAENGAPSSGHPRKEEGSLRGHGCYQGREVSSSGLAPSFLNLCGVPVLPLVGKNNRSKAGMLVFTFMQPERKDGSKFKSSF